MITSCIYSRVNGKSNSILYILRCSTRYQILKRCTRSLAKPRSYEETIRCRFDPALEPMPAEATPLSPPCCVSTHRSRVVDPDGPTTFLDHREALFGIPQMTAFAQRSGHLERFPIESSPPPLAEDSYWGEAPCLLAPCTHGLHVTSPSVGAWSAFVLAICFFSWSSPRSIPSKRRPGFPACIPPSFQNCCNRIPRWPSPR